MRGEPPAVNAAGTIGIVRGVAADDDPDGNPDEEAASFGSPLPPDDRLWRHPSELGLVAAIDNPSPRGARPWTAAVSGLAGVVLTLGLVAVVASIGPSGSDRQVVERVPVTPVSFETFSADRRGAGQGGIAERVGPAVVRLEVQTAGPSATIGSGFVFRNDGHVLTNAHLLTGARRVTVVTHDGRELDATVVGSDTTTDVAVIKIAGGLPTTVALGSADGLAVGAPATAIGAPLGPDDYPAVAVGTIAALGRQVDTDAGPLHDMIATDAPFSSTSSGGPLVDGSGVVIGIVTDAGAPASGAGAPGFAIPIDLARSVADDIIEIGRARRVWLGIEGTDLDAARAAVLGVSRGALVSTVVVDSPAARAGLSDGDVIVALEGVPIVTMSSLVAALRRHDPGDRVRVDYIRANRSASCEVSLAAMEPPR